MNSIINVNNLSKSFGKNKALNDISFNVEKNEIFGILGPDGAGKTTLMRILSGIMDIDSGDIDILNLKIPKQSTRLNDHIAYMPQRFGLYEDLSVIENIYFYSDLFNMKRDKNLEDRIDFLLEFCRMNPFRKRYAGKLSGGMKQKLALVCSLIHTPKILFLDEPTNGVDPVSRREFWKILQSMLKEDVTIFVSTTYLDEAEHCNRIALLDKGKIIKIDSPKHLKKSSEYKIFKLITKDKFKLIEKLKEFNFIESPIIMGDSVHIFIKKNGFKDEFINKINESLKTDKITEISPNLEDVFIENINKNN